MQDLIQGSTHRLVRTPLGPHTARCDLVRYFSCFIGPTHRTAPPGHRATGSGPWILGLIDLVIDKFEIDLYW